MAAMAVGAFSPTVAAADAPQGAPNETLVMPFDNPQVDPAWAWLSEGSAVLFAEHFERYGGRAVPREERLRVFERLQLPPAAALSHATVIKVGQLVGATSVVIGEFELASDYLMVKARLIRLDAGRLEPEIVESGPIADLFDIYDRAARRLRGAESPAPPPEEGTVLASRDAFEAYVRGLTADVPSMQRAYLEQALREAPADDKVRLALWEAYTEAGSHLEALGAVAAVRSTSLLARRARYLSARSLIALKRYDDAFDTLTALQHQSASAAVLNALGVVQLRRGSASPDGRAVYYFSQASQVDPSDADYFFNLGYGYWLDKDAPAAVYWLREAVRRDPADADAHLVLAAALQQTGAAAEAARERTLAARLSAGYEESAEQTPETITVPRGLERLKESIDRPPRRVDAIIASVGQRDQENQARFHLEAGRRAFEREADWQAEQELRRALYLSPYLAEAHLLLGRVHLRSGRPSEAVQALQIALWSEQTVAGHLALAEAYMALQNFTAARGEVDRALALDPRSEEARALRAKIDAQDPGPDSGDR